MKTYKTIKQKESLPKRSSRRRICKSQNNRKVSKETAERTKVSLKKKGPLEGGGLREKHTENPPRKQNLLRLLRSHPMRRQKPIMRQQEYQQ